MLLLFALNLTVIQKIMYAIVFIST